MLTRSRGGRRNLTGRQGAGTEVGNGHDQGLSSGLAENAVAGNFDPLESAENGGPIEPEIISEQGEKTANVVDSSERRRILNEEEGAIMNQLQRIQEEKTHLELEQNPANPAAPPRGAQAAQKASAPFGEVNLQQQDFVDAMSAAFSQGLRAVQNRDVELGFVNRLTANREIFEFSGDSLEWLRFKRAFDASTVAGNYSDEENVTRLYELLKGDARKAVESLMFTTRSAVEIMGALELLYGGKDRILQKLVGALRKLPCLSSGEISIVKFASHVRNNVTAIRSIGDKGYLSNPDLFFDVLRKLPETMVLSYNEFVARSSRASDLTALADFLGDQAKIANLAGTARVLDGVRKSDAGRRESNRRVYAAEVRERSRSPVWERQRFQSPLDEIIFGTRGTRGERRSRH